MRICVNIVRNTVRMVTQCQNQTQPKLTMIDQLHPSNKSAPLNTPACAVKPTSLLPITAATGTPARPQKNSDHPAVAVPIILKTRYHTRVGINPAAIKQSAYRTPGTGTRTQAKMMIAHPPIPELLEQFMESGGVPERWITVQELRTHFNLDDTASPAISGFLRRIYQGPFFTCPFRVTRIERLIVNTPHMRMIKRYFVTRRPGSGKGAGSSCLSPPARIIGNINSRDSTMIEQEET